MSRADAQNFGLGLPGSLLSQNSDGDLIAVLSLFSTEALKSAEKMAPTNPHKLENNGSNTLWSFISKDAVLGLYTGTRNK